MFPLRRVPVTRPHPARQPSVRFIQHIGIGYKNLDPPAVESASIYAAKNADALRYTFARSAQFPNHDQARHAAFSRPIHVQLD
jgi:hypothetical protein